MAGNDAVWDNLLAGEGTPANSFEMILAVKIGSSWIATADITNLNPAFTSVTRQRQFYAQKGKNSQIKVDSDLTISWDHEAIRDDQGQFQAVLRKLLDADFAVGMQNLVELRVYDALGADYAIEGRFSISINRTNTDWNSAAAFTVTATSYDRVQRIENPVLVGLAPVITSISPAGRAATQKIYLQGENFTAPVTVTVGGVAATGVVVISSTLVEAVMPAGAAGTVQVIAESPQGPSEPVSYGRG